MQHVTFYLEDPFSNRINRRWLREQYWHLQHGLCAYCGSDTDLPQSGVIHGGENPCLATLDHVTPRAQKNWNNAANQIVACYGCNQEKQDEPLATYLPRKMKSLTLEQLERIAFVQQALLAQFYTMHDGRSSFSFNPYLRINVTGYYNLRRLQPVTAPAAPPVVVALQEEPAMTVAIPAALPAATPPVADATATPPPPAATRRRGFRQWLSALWRRLLGPRPA